MTNSMALAVAAATMLSSAALAGGSARVSTEHGIDFVTVGAPGNRHMRTQERYYNFNLYPVTERVGRVNYRYRIGQTETTSTQWLNFVRAFGEHWEDLGGQRLDSEFNGGTISPATLNPNVVTDWFIHGGAEQRAVKMSWRVAAYYCNYLHNGAPVITDPASQSVPWEVFAGGAYDASTFSQNPDASFNDQVRRSEGARFWIPDLNEWTKAAYYDPQRYADGNPGPYNGAIPDQEGTGGYWLYPHGSQTEPIVGNPEDGGETNGVGPDGQPLDVGSYPTVQTPWGALDMTGGVSEWTESIPGMYETPYGLVHSGTRYVLGSTWPFVNDQFSTGFSISSARGLRIAAAIPAPGTALVVLAAGLGLIRRRR